MSVSSIRSRKRPPAWRAASQLKRAVRALPRCSQPVGLGAKRTVTMDSSFREGCFFIAHPRQRGQQKGSSGSSRKGSLAPDPGFSRRFLIVFLGGSELASRHLFYGRSLGCSDSLAGRPLPGRLSSKDDSERLNPPWSLRASLARTCREKIETFLQTKQPHSGSHFTV